MTNKPSSYAVYYITFITVSLLLFNFPAFAQTPKQKIVKTSAAKNQPAPVKMLKTVDMTTAYQIWVNWYQSQYQGKATATPTLTIRNVDEQEGKRIQAIWKQAQVKAERDFYHQLKKSGQTEQTQMSMLPKVDMKTAYKIWFDWYQAQKQGIQQPVPSLKVRNVNEKELKRITTIWNNAQIKAEIDVQNQPAQVNQSNSQWVTTFYVKDAQGSTRALTDANGNVTDTFDYDSYGNLINRTGNTLNTRLYNGEEFDQDLGFYYLRARFLDTIKGRFVTQDTFEGMNDDPLSLHKYAYASDDPVNNQDPSGLASISTIANTSIFNQITLSSAKLQTSSFLGQGGSTVGGTPIRTLKGQLCDFQLGFLFGGFGAVAAANGFEPDGTYRAHLDPNAEKYMHIYGNKESTAITSVFIPGNGVLVNKLSASYSTYLFHYDNFQGRKSVELTASHIQGFRLENQIQALKRKSSRNTNLKIPIENASAVRNAAGFVFIGLIGGLGGEATPKGNYIHSHFVIGNKVVGSGDRFVGDLSFPQVFCGNIPNRLPIDKVLTQDK